MKISFFVPGRPAPGGSKSAFINHKNGKVIMAPASKYTRNWMDTVSTYARCNYSGPVLTGPLAIRFRFYINRPKSHRNNQGMLLKPGRERPFLTIKPDLTKLTRSTEDALTGIIWKDDCQVVISMASKSYCNNSTSQGVDIEVCDIWDLRKKES
jgi:crossover junction endodeoxyribonuclease RusA